MKNLICKVILEYGEKHSITFAVWHSRIRGVSHITVGQTFDEQNRSGRCES